MDYGSFMLFNNLTTPTLIAIAQTNVPGKHNSENGTDNASLPPEVTAMHLKEGRHAPFLRQEVVMRSRELEFMEMV
jgi:hypothetical protein